MSPFAIQNPYPPPHDDVASTVVPETDFEIASDVSDADLLALKQEIAKASRERAPRDISDATKALEVQTLARWKR